MKERRSTQPLVIRCKLVLVGDVQCGKTAMLQVLAKDCYPEVSLFNEFILFYCILFYFEGVHCETFMQHVKLHHVVHLL